jgi:hypothetical protein
MNRLTTTLALSLITLSPLPLWAAGTSTADIQATGTAPSFCNIKNDGGAIAMLISTNGDQLSGEGGYSFVANGNAKVVLSAVKLDAPAGAAAATPSLSLVDLVSNSSPTADAASKPSGGVVRQQGKIAAAITQNNDSGMLTSGAYSLTATATCTSL